MEATEAKIGMGMTREAQEAVERGDLGVTGCLSVRGVGSGAPGHNIVTDS